MTYLELQGTMFVKVCNMIEYFRRTYHLINSANTVICEAGAMTSIVVKSTIKYMDVVCAI